jgi:hypothetical protein
MIQSSISNGWHWTPNKSPLLEVYFMKPFLWSEDLPVPAAGT